MISFDRARSAFKEADLRMTPQRIAIINVLVGNRTHPTIDDVFQAVHRDHPTISLATVYQTLALLAKSGLVQQLHGGKDGLRCDPDVTPHAHAHCDNCGAVFDLPLSAPPAYTTDTLDGFTLRKTEVSLYGECMRCRRHQASCQTK